MERRRVRRNALPALLPLAIAGLRALDSSGGRRRHDRHGRARRARRGRVRAPAPPRSGAEDGGARRRGRRRSLLRTARRRSPFAAGLLAAALAIFGLAVVAPFDERSASWRRVFLASVLFVGAFRHQADLRLWSRCRGRRLCARRPARRCGAARSRRRRRLGLAFFFGMNAARNGRALESFRACALAGQSFTSLFAPAALRQATRLDCNVAAVECRVLARGNHPSPAPARLAQAAGPSLPRVRGDNSADLHQSRNGSDESDSGYLRGGLSWC